MKRITLNQLINGIMFLYILSLYTISSQAGWNVLSNGIALVLIGLVWLEMIFLRKKIVFNRFLCIYLLFIIVCIVSVLYATDPNTSFEKVQTMVLIYILMLSFINYVDTLEKLYFIMKCFVFSGFMTSIYILINADFTTLIRFGSDLGNVNEIGLDVGISLIFALCFLLKSKNYWYSLIIVTNLVVILLTGSRKALILVAIALILVLFFQENSTWRRKLRSLLISTGIIVAIYVAIINVPIFYEIIGIRMVSMFNFISGIGIADASINIRSDMIQLGWSWFVKRPFWGYGIDNFRILYGSVGVETHSYSHNNIIELLVGIGLIGTITYYLTNIMVIGDLLKASKIISKTVCFSFIAIIFGYMLLSVGLVYYFDKDISIILALGSIIYRLADKKG